MSVLKKFKVHQTQSFNNNNKKNVNIHQNRKKKKDKDNRKETDYLQWDPWVTSQDQQQQLKDGRIVMSMS